MSAVDLSSAVVDTEFAHLTRCRNVLLATAASKIQEHARKLGCSQVIFVSREGSVFNYIFKNLQQLGLLDQNIEATHLPTSRKALNRALIENGVFRNDFCSIEMFSGDVGQFLSGRFAITAEELEKNFSKNELARTLENEQGKALSLISKMATERLKGKLKNDFNITAEYLTSKFRSKEPALIMDIGFKGTIQEQINLITNRVSPGIYLSLQPNHLSGSLKFSTLNGRALDKFLEYAFFFEGLFITHSVSVSGYKMDQNGFINPIEIQDDSKLSSIITQEDLNDIEILIEKFPKSLDKLSEYYVESSIPLFEIIRDVNKSRSPLLENENSWSGHFAK